MYAPRLLASTLLFAGLAGPLCAQSAGPLVLPSTLLEEVRIPPPLRLAEQPLARPLAELKPAVFAARKELQQVQEWLERFWNQRLDALGTELARGKRQRRLREQAEEEGNTK